MEKHGIWVQIGFDGRRSRTGDPRPWRCFFDEDPTTFWVERFETKLPTHAIGWLRTGKSTTENLNGLLGWVQLFGTCVIRDDVLYIVPETPTGDPPARQAPR